MERNDSSSNLRISGNGRFVAFDSFASNLVAGDTNSRRDVFVHDLPTTTEPLSETLYAAAIGPPGVPRSRAEFGLR